MSCKTLPGLEQIVDGWIVKKSAHQLQGRLTEDEVEELAKAVIETFKQRALGESQNDWGKLQELTASWIVQKRRGELPRHLDENDFHNFVKLALNGLAQGTLIKNIPVDDELATKELTNHPSDENQKTDRVGKKILEERDEDVFRFAREHLARCL